MPRRTVRRTRPHSECFGRALVHGQAGELEDAAAGSGYLTGAPEADADLVVFVICAVGLATENRMFARPGSLRVRGERVLAAWCMGSAQAGRVLDANPGAQLLPQGRKARRARLRRRLSRANNRRLPGTARKFPDGSLVMVDISGAKVGFPAGKARPVVEIQHSIFQ